MKVYSLFVPKIPSPFWHPILARRAVRFLVSLPGIVGMSPDPKIGNVLAFATLTHAEKAQQKFEVMRIPCGKYIMNAELYEKEGQRIIRVISPVDGWPEGMKHENQTSVGLSEVREAVHDPSEHSGRDGHS